MSNYIVELQSISKNFGGVQALRDVSMGIAAGEVLGLVGDNGAGKSTLVKLISASLRPDSGSLVLAGARAYPTSPLGAQRAGINVVYQDLALAPNLTAVGNIFLGRELKRWRWLGPLSVLDEPSMYEHATRSIKELGLVSSEDLSIPVANMSGGQRQIVAIARAIFASCRVLILDEPTAALGVAERARVLAMIKELSLRANIAIMVVSHNIEELMSVVDRIVVLRLGRVVAVFEKAQQASALDVVAAITGVGVAY